MKFAVVDIQGRQYQVQEGEKLEVQRLDAEPGKTFVFGQVLLMVENDEIEVGTPYLNDYEVKALILEQKKGEKIRVANYKAKSRYRRVRNFRPSLSVIEIKAISKKKNGKK